MQIETRPSLNFADVGGLFLLRDGTTDTITGKTVEGETVTYHGKRGPWDKFGRTEDEDQCAGDILKRVLQPAWRVDVLSWKDGKDVAKIGETIWFREHLNALLFVKALKENADPDDQGICRGTHGAELVAVPVSASFRFQEDEPS